MSIQANSWEVITSNGFESDVLHQENWREPYHDKPMVECYCPRCEKKHNQLLFWTGRGIPRVFCSSCRSYC